MRFTYDDSGLQTSEAYYSLDGKPYTDKELKYHKIVYTYNSMRLTESATYYGVNDKPINGSSGYSTTKYKYNDQNQRTQISKQVQKLNVSFTVNLGRRLLLH